MEGAPGAPMRRGRRAVPLAPCRLPPLDGFPGEEGSGLLGVDEIFLRKSKMGEKLYKNLKNVIKHAFIILIFKILCKCVLFLVGLVLYFAYNGRVSEYYNYRFAKRNGNLQKKGLAFLARVCKQKPPTKGQDNRTRI